MTEFAWPRNGVELPLERAGRRVESHDVARHVLDPGLAVAGLVPHQHDHHAVDDNGRRRSGDHAELSRDAVIGVVARSTVLPSSPVRHERWYQVEAPRIRKAIQRHRRPPVLEWSAGLGVERPQEERRTRDENHPAAVHLGVGDAFPVGLPGRAEMPDRLGLAKRPERLAGGELNRHHLSPRRGHSVEHAIDVDRGRPVEVIDIGTEIVAPPEPRHFEVTEVVAVDLVQG